MKIDTCQSVWDAIADGPEEAANLNIRSRLMDILASYIRSEEITQKEAARRFGVPHSQVSEVVNDKSNYSPPRSSFLRRQESSRLNYRLRYIITCPFRTMLFTGFPPARE